MTDTERPFSFRSVALAAFLPTLLFSIGEGSIIPIIPVVAHSQGASIAMAGFIAAMLMVGEVLGDVPSGWLVARMGERAAMIGAALLAVVGVVVCLLAQNYWVLLIGVFVVGIATSTFALARHSFMTTFVPIRYRARALSTLGGIFRAGWFVGPLIASLVINLTGTTQTVFWIFIASCLGSVVVLLILPDPEKMFGPAARPEEAPTHSPANQRNPLEHKHNVFRTIWDFRAVLLRMGVAAALVSAVRSARTVLLPLWGVSIGLHEANIALIVGITGLADFALFYASGQIMDKFGRLWSGLPSMLGMGLGFLALAFTHDIDSRVMWFIAAAFVVAVSNGVGSGIIMTFGADLAPKSHPAPFLGAWRFFADSGQAAAPLIVSLLTAVASISIACTAVSVMAFLGAHMLWRYVPRYIPRTRTLHTSNSE